MFPKKQNILYIRKINIETVDAGAKFGAMNKVEKFRLRLSGRSLLQISCFSLATHVREAWL
jgi:hypothetical protein